MLSDKDHSLPVAGESPNTSGAERFAIAVGALWFIGAGAYLVFGPDSGEGFDRTQFLLTAVTLLTPLAALFVGLASARSARIYRSEIAALRQSVEGLRKEVATDREARAKVKQPDLEKKLDALMKATQKTEETVRATFTSARASGAPILPLAKGAPEEAQPLLALGTPIEDLHPPISNKDLIRALNFPESDADKEGIAAMRAALKDRQARQVVHASQDILTLLSHDGIYMDDMRPDRARPELWRRFAKGERGKTIAALGGIRDRSSLALTSARMRNDAIFRDTAHHFLRRFDQLLQSFEETATDQEIASLTETRTARAFMLLGRVSGSFD